MTSSPPPILEHRLTETWTFSLSKSDHPCWGVLSGRDTQSFEVGFKPALARCCDASLPAKQVCSLSASSSGGLGSQFKPRIVGLYDLGVIRSTRCSKILCATCGSA